MPVPPDPPDPVPPLISVYPVGPMNLGSILSGSPTTFSITIRNLNHQAEQLTITSIVSSNPDYTFPGLVVPFVVNRGTAHVVSCSVTPSAPGATNTIFTITGTAADPVPNSPFSYHVDATAVGGGSLLMTVTPSPLGFGTRKIGGTYTAIITLLNNGTGGFTVSTVGILAGSDPSFTILSPPATPFVLNAGDHQDVTIQYAPTQLGLQNGTFRVTTNIGAQLTVDTALSGLSVPLIPAFVLSGNVRAFVFGVYNALNYKFVQDDFNCQFDSVLVFNGVLWGAVGTEKTLQRLYVMYENVGVCNGLKARVDVLRPSLGADHYDFVEKTITIGTALADGKVRSAFFDMQISGEIAYLTLTRIGNSGPVNLVGFVPSFDVKGEKVEGV